MRSRTTTLILLALCLLGLGFKQVTAPSPESLNSRYASHSGTDIFGDSAARITYLEQNWDADDSLWFYNTTQGSNLMPLNLFLHLEQAESQELFRSDQNMRRHRYLSQASSPENPHGLPVGFVPNRYQNKDYVGLTCAACHTGQINYQGVGIRVDGAPALTDLENMMYELEAALRATLAQPEKLARLAQRLSRQSPPQKQALREELNKALQDRHQYNHNNRPLHKIDGETQQHAYGYGRIDAVDRIFNRLLQEMSGGDFTPNPANAPVSYPQLWDTPQHDFVEWNGYGNNGSIGALARNSGQVMGVFGDFSLEQQDGNPGFRSSVNKRNLLKLERHLRKLHSPQWPKFFPSIDTHLASKGREVFLEYRCNQCHADMQRDDPERRITTQLITVDIIGTDSKMADNATQYSGPSGILEGKPWIPIKPELGNLGETTAIASALTTATLGVVIDNSDVRPWWQRWPENIFDLAMIKLYPLNPSSKRHIDFEVGKKEGNDRFWVYKSRPLNGLWATAPFLHNGSVPNLYEMFLPSCSDAEIASGKQCRANHFTVGSREFDPIKVGLVEKSKAQYPDLYLFDTNIPGNSNRGHEYVAGVTPYITLNSEGIPVRDSAGNYVMEKLPAINEDKRVALVEYLKTL